MHFRAMVIAGEKRGRQMDFPTINLVIPADFKLAKGVYATRVKVEAGKLADELIDKPKTYRGLMHFGPRATFNDLEDSLEIHLLDFDQDLYNQEVQVEVIKKLRDLKKFNSVEELKQQINADILTAQPIFKKDA